MFYFEGGIGFSRHCTNLTPLFRQEKRFFAAILTCYLYVGNIYIAPIYLNDEKQKSQQQKNARLFQFHMSDLQHLLVY